MLTETKGEVLLKGSVGGKEGEEEREEKRGEREEGRREAESCLCGRMTDRGREKGREQRPTCLGGKAEIRRLGMSGVCLINRQGTDREGQQNLNSQHPDTLLFLLFGFCCCFF